MRRRATLLQIAGKSESLVIGVTLYYRVHPSVIYKILQLFRQVVKTSPLRSQLPPENWSPTKK